jgi:hypothetical protein
MRGPVLHIVVIFTMGITAFIMVCLLKMEYKYAIMQTVAQSAGYIVGLTVKDVNK